MAHSPQQIIDYAERLNHFAELLSREIPVRQICERMGVRKGQGYRWLGEIRAGLGWQAQ